jgi:hypothetical protein
MNVDQLLKLSTEHTELIHFPVNDVSRFLTMAKQILMDENYCKGFAINTPTVLTGEGKRALTAALGMSESSVNTLWNILVPHLQDIEVPDQYALLQRDSSSLFNSTIGE